MFTDDILSVVPQFHFSCSVLWCSIFYFLTIVVLFRDTQPQQPLLNFPGCLMERESVSTYVLGCQYDANSFLLLILICVSSVVMTVQ